MDNQEFDKGFENGLGQVPKESYEGFIDSSTHLSYLQNEKKELDLKIQEYRESLLKTSQMAVDALAQKQQLMVEYGSQCYHKDRFEGKINTQRDHILAINEIKTKETTPYPFLAALIYLLAGITFIVGDLIISHEIVAYALNIKNNIHAWAFAFGLASVSILLKPAYDRLIEQPYLQNKGANNRKIHGAFQTALVLIAVLTLGVLGYFRYESYRISELKKGINQEIKALKQDNIPEIGATQEVLNPQLNAQIESKLAAFNNLNLELVNSKWALMSFILSGILFAIAGAICLGIAFPSLQVFWRRWFQHNWGIMVSNFSINGSQRKLNKLLPNYFKNKAQIDFLDNKQSLLPNLEVLNAELEMLKERKTLLHAQMQELEAQSKKYNFSDGYDMGNVSTANMTDQELEELRVQQLQKLHQKKTNIRPHQVLRKAIIDNLNDN